MTNFQPCDPGERPGTQILLGGVLSGSARLDFLLPGGQGTEMKACTKCRVVKGLEDFYRDKRSKDGFRARCKDCDKEENARWYADNPDKNREASARWRAKNPDKVRDANARWCAENPDKARERNVRWRAENRDKFRNQRAQWRAENRDKAREANARYRDRNPDAGQEARARWCADNPDKVREARARWCAANPDRCAQHGVIRRTRLQQACVSWADQEAIAAIYRLRDKLTAETGVPHHVDHVVPLRSHLVCGLHVHNNLQVIPAVDNMKKHNRFSCE